MCILKFNVCTHGLKRKCRTILVSIESAHTTADICTLDESLEKKPICDWHSVKVGFVHLWLRPYRLDFWRRLYWVKSMQERIWASNTIHAVLVVQFIQTVASVSYVEGLRLLKPRRTLYMHLANNASQGMKLNYTRWREATTQYITIVSYYRAKLSRLVAVLVNQESLANIGTWKKESYNFPRLAYHSPFIRNIT